MALTDNITAYWKLDESSGNAADSVASNTLTNTNTVGYSAGKINNAADFVGANSTYFIAGSPVAALGAKSYSFWTKVTTITQDDAWLANGGGAALKRGDK